MSEVEDKYTRETITSMRVWVPGKLFSFTCTRPTGFRFTAGQFARLGVDNTLQLPGEPEIIWRAYSMVSGPFDEHLEFFSIVVPEGAFYQSPKPASGGFSCLHRQNQFRLSHHGPL